MITKLDAILSLDPNAHCRLANDEVTWMTTPISEADIAAERAKLQAEYDAQDYARKRKAAYPNIYDYMDGIVKNDQAQIDKYIADSQAVKARYKKG